MAIEPLGSVMSTQIQTTAMQKPQVAETTADSADVVVHASEKVDNTTAVVESAQEKGQSNTASEQGKEQSGEQIRKAVERLNKNMTNSEAIFGIHEETNRITIKIVDKDTKEVIKELPPEKTLDMIAKAWEFAVILIDERR